MKPTRLSALLTLGVLLIAALPALAQTDTPTETPTLTPTASVTATSTRTPTRAAVCTTDWCAYHYGSFKIDAGTAANSFTREIPGIKPGDLFVIYPLTEDCLGSVNTIQNNFVTVTLSCATDVAEQNVEYLWFSRTQDRCQGEDNCQRAFTVTPTP